MLVANADGSEFMPQTLNDIEHGRLIPEPAILAQIARILDIEETAHEQAAFLKTFTARA